MAQHAHVNCETDLVGLWNEFYRWAFTTLGSSWFGSWSFKEMLSDKQRRLQGTEIESSDLCQVAVSAR